MISNKYKLNDGGFFSFLKQNQLGKVKPRKY